MSTEITRGTTPGNTFEVPIDLTTAEVLYITYSQYGNVVFEIELPDITVSATKLIVKLTQEQTLALQKGQVSIQIRGRYPNGTAVASDIINTTTEEILKDGVI